MAEQDLLLRVRADANDAVTKLAHLSLELKAVESSLRSAQDAYRSAGGAADSYKQEIVANVAALQQEKAAIVAQTEALKQQLPGFTGITRGSQGAQMALRGLATGAQQALTSTGSLGQRLLLIANDLPEVARGLSQVAAESGEATSRFDNFAAGVGAASGAITGMVAVGAVLVARFQQMRNEAEEAGEAAARSFYDVEVATASLSLRTAEAIREQLALAESLEARELATLSQIRADYTLIGSTGMLLGSMLGLGNEFGEATRRANEFGGAADYLRGVLEDLEMQAGLTRAALGGTPIQGAATGPTSLPALEAAIGQGNVDPSRLFLSNPYAPQERRERRGRRPKEISDEEAKLRKFHQTVADGIKWLDGYKQTLEAGAVAARGLSLGLEGAAGSVVMVNERAATTARMLEEATRMSTDAQAYLAGTLTLADGLATVLGDVAALRFDNFGENLVRALQDTAAAITTTIARALALRGILALLNLIPGGAGWATFLGGALGIPTGGGGVAPGGSGAYALQQGAARLVGGNVVIPVEVIRAGYQRAERMERLTGR